MHQSDIMKQLLCAILCLFFFRSSSSTVIPRTESVSNFEIFYSQQSIISPCDGTPVIFDFGYINMTLTKSGNVVSGSLYLQQTLRNSGFLHSQKQSGKFSFNVVPDASVYKGVLQYDVSNSPFSIVYILMYGYDASRVTTVQLEDLQVAKC